MEICQPKNIFASTAVREIDVLHSSFPNDFVGNPVLILDSASPPLVSRIRASGAPGDGSSATGLPRGEGKPLFSFPSWGKVPRRGG